MKYSTTVMDMNTGNTQVFTLKPSEAVMSMFLQSLNNYKTEEYHNTFIDLYPKLVWGKKTVAMGDFVARTETLYTGGWYEEKDD